VPTPTTSSPGAPTATGMPSALTAAALAPTGPEAGGSPAMGTAPTQVSSAPSADPAGSLVVTAAGSASTILPAMMMSDPALIDDFEDGDAMIIAIAGRSGQWTAYNDGTTGGTQTPSGAAKPEAGGANGAGYAVHTTGSGFASWGAGIQLDLANAGSGASARKPFDASAYQGIRFYAKGTGAVRVELPTLATIDSAGGGSCATKCSDTHGQQLTLTADWTLITVPFSKLAQEGWGTVAALDPKTILGIAFKVPGTKETPAKFDFWVDDLSFASTAMSTDPVTLPVVMESSSVPGKCATQKAYDGNGSVTYYTFEMGSKEVNCSYPISGRNPDKVAHISTGNGGYFGAMNTTDYAESAMCGACVEVSRDNGKKVVITIVDQCPISDPKNQKCKAGHIDLSQAAFTQLGSTGEGYLGTGNGGMTGKISWKYVACPTTEKISFKLKEPDNASWNQVLVQGHAFAIKGVTINGKEAKRQSYNYWEPPDGKMGSEPYQIQVTDVNGGVVTAWIKRQAGDIDSGQQLSCQ
jgi:expansin